MASAKGTDRWAVVDVETTGTDPRTCRVISVAALAMTDSGAVTDSVVSLLNADVDPGPTHIHGLTRQMLCDQPQFTDIVTDLARLLRGRTMVAHNAGFDYTFLAAEARRAGIRLPVDSVMCTVELASQLDLRVGNLKLATLAHHWGITQARPHDALDDTQVLAQVLTHQLVIAAEKGVPLPLRKPDDLRPPVFRNAA
ncbi:DNA polymerase III subunit epsilon [Mycolicibacterium fortuitum]|uniref:DNA polymerase III subunit epsilon n=1 Tax=Mycolicibacterium fortuitum TaxID=1766 RepID=A0ABD6QTG7_MYCFO|nr:DNA polymerase III subunit epsilon [Mycolicibacterium fortuitum]